MTVRWFYLNRKHVFTMIYRIKVDDFCVTRRNKRLWTKPPVGVSYQEGLLRAHNVAGGQWDLTNYYFFWKLWIIFHLRFPLEVLQSAVGRHQAIAGPLMHAHGEIFLTGIIRYEAASIKYKWPLTDWLTDCLTAWLTDWLADWRTDWPIGWLMCD